MTLEQIVNQIRNFADLHDQIKSFYEGELTKENVTKTHYYYRLMCEEIPSTINQGNETFDFRIGCFGRVNLDQSNRLNTLSDTRQILTDFISFFTNNPNLVSVKLSLPITITDYIEYQDD